MSLLRNSNTTSAFLARSVRFFRRSLGMSQTQLAQVIELSLRHLQKIEAGTTNIRLSTLETLSKNLEAPACYMLRDESKSGLESYGLGCVVELLDLIPVGVQFHDLTGRILFSNRTHRELIGFTNEDLRKGIYIWDFLAPSESKEASKFFLETLIQEMPPPSPYYAKNQTKSGEIIPLKVDWNYWKQKSGRVSGFISVFTVNPTW